MKASSVEVVAHHRTPRTRALFGAHWRLVEVSPGRAIIDLCACTGELVERVEGLDGAVIEYVRTRRSDEG